MCAYAVCNVYELEGMSPTSTVYELEGVSPTSTVYELEGVSPTSTVYELEGVSPTSTVYELEGVSPTSPHFIGLHKTGKLLSLEVLLTVFLFDMPVRITSALCPRLQDIGLRI